MNSTRIEKRNTRSATVGIVGVHSTRQSSAASGKLVIMWIDKGHLLYSDKGKSIDLQSRCG